MNELLEALYDRFYTPPELAEFAEAAEHNRLELVERLDKPERKLLLRIIDSKNRCAEELSLDSFICGFKLAWQMTNELNHYRDGHSTPADRAGLDARSRLQKEED